jgi:hypothetical protein
MIAAPVQCDVDGIPKGSHYVLLKRASVRHERHDPACRGMSARWRGHVFDCSWDVLGVGRGNDPAVHSSLVNRDERRWKAWISERSNRDCQVFFHSLRLVVDGRSAAWTEVELAMRAFVAHAHVLRRGARERDVLAPKPGLLPEDAASSALTGQAVANGDTHRLADNSSLELTTTAGGNMVGHVSSPRAPNYPSIGQPKPPDQV